MKNFIKAVILFIILFLVTMHVNARKFYFSSTLGSDSYSVTQAQNQLTPWKTLVKLQNLITNGNTTFLPGDTIAFKRGDKFANGNTAATGFSYASFSWANIPGGYTAPSGTQLNPIVLTNYGTGDLPNFYHPDSTNHIPTFHNPNNVFYFAGVSWIVIDGLQFNDRRFSVTNHSTPAYTTGSILMGEITNTRLQWNGSSYDTIWGSNRDTANRVFMVKHFVVKNCYFSNSSYGFASVYADSSVITKNTFINFKSSADTIGTFDVMAGPIDGLNGDHMQITHNYFKNYWGKSGRNSSAQGMGGVALNTFSLKHTLIAYNTFIDGRHPMEVGNLDHYDTMAGAQYDTFAYNKIIDNPNLVYFQGAGSFSGNVHNQYIWNNTMINNNTSRQSGPNFGYDREGDGTNFSQFWFFRNKNRSTNYIAHNVTVSSSSFNVTVTDDMDGIEIGGYVYGPEGSSIFPLDGNGNPSTTPVVITGISGNIITLNTLPAATGSTYFIIYRSMPNLGITWSNPPNPSTSGNGDSWDNPNSNHRPIQYSSDVFEWGNGFDTLVESKNNIFYNTVGLQQLYEVGRTRFKHSNNIYYLKGGYSYTTSTGATINNLSRLGTDAVLGTNERIYSTKLFKDSSAAMPENWDLRIDSATSFPVTNGSVIPSLTRDYSGSVASGVRTMGIYQNKTVGALNATVTVLGSITCTSLTTVASVTATGGTPPYIGIGKYSVTAGVKQFTVTDAVGASQIVTIQVNQKPTSCP